MDNWRRLVRGSHLRKITKTAVSSADDGANLDSVLVPGLACHSCADIPSCKELAAAGIELQVFARELG